MAKFTTEQRVTIVSNWIKNDHDYQMLTQQFALQYPGSRIPSRMNCHKLYHRFMETGSVADRVRSGRPREAHSVENLQTVAEFYVENPRVSQRRAALELDIRRSSLQRLMKTLKFKAYRPRLLHALNEDDFDRRVQFCEEFLVRLAADPNLTNRILWTDEASFKMNGMVNRHNSVYWADTNPHDIVTQELNAPGVNVWAGISSHGIIGPFFFDRTVTGESYEAMLMEVILPELQNSPLYEPWQDIIWQQDGAPPHWALSVRACLAEHFAEWIGRRGTWEWPARSCDLTPLDFAVWGIIKEKVYATRPNSIAHLRQLIEESFQELNDDADLIQRIIGHVPERVNLCIANRGHHFEHLKN